MRRRKFKKFLEGLDQGTFTVTIGKARVKSLMLETWKLQILSELAVHKHDAVVLFFSNMWFRTKHHRKLRTLAINLPLLEVER